MEDVMVLLQELGLSTVILGVLAYLMITYIPKFLDINLENVKKRNQREIDLVKIVHDNTSVIKNNTDVIKNYLDNAKKLEFKIDNLANELSKLKIK